MKAYQIKDWQKHFENDRSRDRDKCGFVCVPNKQHGMGFSYIMFEKDGAAIYGIWQLIVGACSQQRKPRNGWLTSDGTASGDVWTVDDLAMKFRRPAIEIARAIEVLSSVKVGWLVQLPTDSPLTPRQVTPDSPLGGDGTQGVDNKDLPPTPVALPPDSRPTPLEEKGRERNEGERREEKEPLYPEVAFPSWDQWWGYCQMIGLGAEWKAKDEWQKQESKNWANIQNWQAHASRVRTWWESDGRPMQPRTKKPGRNKGPNI